MSERDRAPLRIAMISYYLPSESKIGVGYQVDALADELGATRSSTSTSSAPARPSPAPATTMCTSPSRLACAPSASLSSCAARTCRRLRRPARAWRRLLDVASRVPDATSAPCTARASRRPCTSAGSRRSARMVLLGFSEVLASLVADRTVLVSPQTRRWTPWVKTVIPNGVDTHRFAPALRSRSTWTPRFCSSGPGADASGARSWRRSSRSVCARRVPDAAPQDGDAGCPGRASRRGHRSRPTGRRCARRGVSARVGLLPSVQLRGIRHPVCRGDGRRTACGGDAEPRSTIRDGCRQIRHPLENRRHRCPDSSGFCATATSASAGVPARSSAPRSSTSNASSTSTSASTVLLGADLRAAPQPSDAAEGKGRRTHAVTIAPRMIRRSGREEPWESPSW